MPDELGKRLFTYAVITDTHLNQGETESNSEFAVNKLSNGRMRYVVHDLNRRDLAFVIHLGDLLHPVPAVPHLYQRAAERFKEQVADLDHPLHVLPGNHDIGDKPIDWGPMAIVQDDFIALWRDYFGTNYRAFDYGDCRFILFDSQIINSGLGIEVEQTAWFETELAAATEQGKRIFLNCHYPPFLTYPDEEEHYDNLADPGRAWLLDLMEHHRVEALFAGHVHNVWYNHYRGTDCYLLPSTAFVRLDYAEIYRAVPTPEMESGRNDTAKLGYFLVHVHACGHICEWVRTYGQVSGPDRSASEPQDRVAAIHPRQNSNTRFGFDMRQNWLEVIEVPPSGALDEFDRKRTRNNYALMALLDMGVRRLRIPLRDLLDPDHRARLVDCARHGILFTLFSFGIPDSRTLEAVSQSRGLIDIWEISDSFQNLPSVVEAAAPTTNAARISLYVSKFRSIDELVRDGEKYYHTTSHGFTPDDAEQLTEVAAWDNVDGVVFRIPGETAPWRAAHDVADVCRGHELTASLHIRMTRGSPGSTPLDDDWVANRAAEALVVSAAHRNMHVYLDTFADVDRGYYRRHGVVDRFYNPRQAFHVIRYLNAVVADGFGPQTGDAFTLGHDDATIYLIDEKKRRYYLVSSESSPATEETAQPGWLIDLLSGQRTCAQQTKGAGFTPPAPPHLCLWMPGE